MHPPPDARTSGVATAKQVLRRRLLADRRGLSAAQLADARERVQTHVLKRFDRAAQLGRPWRRVFAYPPMAGEPASTELLDALLERGTVVHVPVRLADNDLDWVRWPRSAPLGVQVVTTASVILVPALAVDPTGARLGRGGGSYDRVLPRVAAQVPAIALLHLGEMIDRVPVDSWDRPVSAAVTPAGWQDLGASSG